MLDSFFTCNNIDECLKLLTHDDNDDLAVGVSRTHAMSTSLFANHKIFCFDRSQNIANYTIALAIRNDVGLVSKINHVLRYILNGGLHIKWSKEHRMRVVTKDNINENLNTVWEPFKLEYFLFSFYYVLFPGLFLAAATFCAECYIAKRKKRPNASTMWKILSDFFDGHRHGNFLRRQRRR